MKALPQTKKIITILVLAIPLALFISGCFTAPASRAGNGVNNRGALLTLARKAWKALPATQSACEYYDYFPNGGMRIFYCHLKTIIDYPEFRKLIGMPVFVSGPHSDTRLDLNSRSGFGHYNRGFITAAREVLIPALHDPAFRAVTQPVYDRYVKKLAQIFYVTHKKIMEHPRFLEAEKRKLISLIESENPHSYNYEPFFFFMNHRFMQNRDEGYLMSNGFDGGWDGNVVKTCVAFWIRRSIDGTEADFFAVLNDLINLYDSGFLELGERTCGISRRTQHMIIR